MRRLPWPPPLWCCAVGTPLSSGGSGTMPRWPNGSGGRNWAGMASGRRTMAGSGLRSSLHPPRMCAAAVQSQTTTSTITMSSYGPITNNHLNDLCVQLWSNHKQPPQRSLCSAMVQSQITTLMISLFTYGPITNNHLKSTWEPSLTFAGGWYLCQDSETLSCRLLYS